MSCGFCCWHFHCKQVFSLVVALGVRSPPPLLGSRRCHHHTCDTIISRQHPYSLTDAHRF